MWQTGVEAVGWGELPPIPVATSPHPSPVPGPGEGGVPPQGDAAAFGLE